MKIDKVGHFNIVLVNARFNIVNTNTGSINSRTFTHLYDAIQYSKQLMYWHNKNHSPSGKRRTKKHNRKVVAKYHKIKIQPKYWSEI